MKTTKALTLATTLLVASQATNVKADEVLDPGLSSEATSSQTVSPSDLEVITQEANQAQAAVEVQEEMVAQTKVDVDKAKQQLQAANQEVSMAEQTLAEATPERQAELEDSIEGLEKQIAQQDQVLSEAKQRVTDAENQVASQEQVVLNQVADVTEQADVVAKVQEAVNVAQATLDGTGASQIIAEREAAEEQLAQAEGTLSQAKEQLREAEAKDKERQSLIADKSFEVAERTQEHDNHVSAYDQAKAAEEAAQHSLTQAEHTLSAARQKLEAINKIVLSDEYISQLKAYAAGGFTSEESLRAEETLKALNAKELQNNQFKANPSEENEQLNPSQLSQEIRQELTQFAVELINQIRRQMGTPEVVAHEQVIDFATAIADRYEKDNWDWKQTTTVNVHHIEGIKALAPEFGLRSSAHYENIHTTGTMYKPVTTLSLAQLKGEVYKALLNFMFNGQEYFHAMSIGGVADYGEPSNYVGVSISNRSDAFSVHVIGVNNRSITDQTKFDRTKILLPTETAETIHQAYNQAVLNQSTASANLNSAQATLLTADVQVKASQAKLDEATKNLADVMATPLSEPTARLAYNQAQSSYHQAEERLQQAKIAEANLNADVATKTALLATAKARLETEQDKLQELDNQKQKALDTLQKYRLDLKTQEEAYQEALADQDELKAELLRLNQLLEDHHQAPERLRMAKENQALAVQRLEALEETLEKEEETLEHLRRTRELLEAQRQALISRYQLAQNKLSEPQDLPKGYRSATNHQAMTAPLPYVSGAYGQSKELPKTSSQSSSHLVLTGLMSLMAALGMRKKRRH